MKLDIVMVVTKHIYDYAKYSIALNAEYAVRHGYGFQVFTAPSPKRHPAWGKVEAAIDHLPRRDWLFVIDADAVFFRIEKSLDEFTKLEGDLLICENGPNGGRPLNTGAMLLRNTPAMRQFLQRWYDEGARYAFNAFWDQEWLNDYYEGVPEESRSLVIRRLPFDAFNSHWLDYRASGCNGRFVLHIMSDTDEVKRQVLQQLYAARCSGPAGKSGPQPPALGQTVIVR